MRVIFQVNKECSIYQQRNKLKIPQFLNRISATRKFKDKISKRPQNKHKLVCTRGKMAGERRSSAAVSVKEISHKQHADRSEYTKQMHETLEKQIELIHRASKRKKKKEFSQMGLSLLLLSVPDPSNKISKRNIAGAPPSAPPPTRNKRELNSLSLSKASTERMFLFSYVFPNTFSSFSFSSLLFLLLFYFHFIF